MVDKNLNQLWFEKYRPTKISECILPQKTKDTFQSFVEKGTFPNLLLHGAAGTGKTTVARALCKELDLEYIFINASEDRNISMVRDRIEDFASRASLTGRKKCIILDEADGLTAVAQGALRGIFEKYNKVRFILTCNYINKIIEPISQSRVSPISFSIPDDEVPELVKQMTVRAATILKQEDVNFDTKVLVQFVKNYYPDGRRILNDLQKYSSGGDIDVGILKSSYNVSEFTNHIINTDWNKAREWLTKNKSIETATLYRDLEKLLYQHVMPESIPALVKILADYLHYSTTTPDTEINNAGMLASILMEVEFKR